MPGISQTETRIRPLTIKLLQHYLDMFDQFFGCLDEFIIRLVAQPRSCYNYGAMEGIVADFPFSVKEDK